MFIVPKYNDDIEGFAQIKEKSVAKQKNGNNVFVLNCHLKKHQIINVWENLTLFSTFFFLFFYDNVNI